MSLYAERRPFPRPEPSQRFLGSGMPLVYDVRLQAGIRKGADRVWDGPLLDVRQLDRTSWRAHGGVMPLTWDAELEAGIRKGAETTAAPRPFDPRFEWTPTPSWIFQNLPGGGPSPAQELPAFLQARQDWPWRPVAFPDVPADPGPLFARLAWSLFGTRNAGELVPAAGRLDVRLIDRTQPAFAYSVLPWTLFAAARNAGGLIGAAPQLDVRSITAPPAWIFSSLPVIGVTTAQLLPALIQARQELLQWRPPTFAEVLARPAPLVSIFPWALFGYQRGAETTASGPILDVRAVDRQGAGWLFATLPAPGLTVAQMIAAFQQHADWLWKPPTFPEVTAKLAPGFAVLPWRLFGFQRGADTTRPSPLLDVRRVERQDTGWIVQPGLDVARRAGAVLRRPDLVWPRERLRPEASIVAPGVFSFLFVPSPITLLRLSAQAAGLYELISALPQGAGVDEAMVVLPLLADETASAEALDTPQIGQIHMDDESGV